MDEEVHAHFADLEARNKERLRRFGQEHQLRLLETWLADTGNPLLAWAAVRYCADKELPLPGWAFGYLAKAASELLEIARTSEPKSAGKESLKALGLSRATGKESPFEEFQRAIKREAASVLFARRILAGEVYKKVRFEVAEEFKISGERLDVWLRDFFPGKRGDDETWLEFLRRGTDLGGPDLDTTLCAVLGVAPRCNLNGVQNTVQSFERG